MTIDKIPDDKLIEIVKYFCSQDSELEYVEFKRNLDDTETIAKTISAIFNYLIMKNIPRGYFIWGVDDKTHEIVGTVFNPKTNMIGNEQLELWLSKYIKPSPSLSFREISIDGKRVVVLVLREEMLEISKYRNNAYIRIGANTRKLSDFPNIEKEVWKSVVERDYEMLIASSSHSVSDVISLLDLNAFYEMRKNRAQVEKDVLLDEAIKCGLIIDNHDSTYDITRYGALLYAKNLNDFPPLTNKTVRIINYNGETKLSTHYEIRFTGGYIAEFNKMYNEILNSVVEKEYIDDDGIRKQKYLYPHATLRELFANMLVHQDLTINTLQPMVEIYSDRIEFVNTGIPLIPINRFVDYPPQTRNIKMAEELYKVGICEKRGSGWDKVANEASEFKFPAPSIDTTENTTRIVLTQHKALNDMTADERIWSIYIYTCLLWVERKYLTNALVRELFGLPKENKSTASFLLAQTVKSGLISVFDEYSGMRNRKYLPSYVKKGS